MKQGLLTKEEVIQHRILIDDLTIQLHRSTTPKEKKEEIERQLRNLKSELWHHNKTRPKKKKTPEKIYTGAEPI